MIISAMSLEIRPLTALCPPSIYFFKTENRKGANAVGIGIGIPPLAITESGDRSPIKHFLYGGRGSITLLGV